MPLYDYECRRCGRFSATRPLKEFDQPAPCPACGALAMRALTAPALIGDADRRKVPSADGRYARLRHPSSCGCCRWWRFRL